MIQNSILLEKPYALNRVAFLRQFYNIASERAIKNSIHTLAKFQTILGTRAAKYFEPDMFTALNDLRDNQIAIQAGLTQIPPVIVNPIPIDINLPKNVPTTTDIPGGAALERWKLTNALYVDFILARAELKEQMRTLLPIEIFNSLEIIGGPRKWANINPEDVFNYVLGENFAKLNDKELEEAEEKISKPWDKKLPLQANLEAMIKANNDLGDSFPELKYSENKMFRIAYKIATSKNYRLVPTVNKFMGPGEDLLTSSFTNFSTFLLANYQNTSHVEENGHLAFICESGYKESKFRPFGLAVTAETEDGGLALAANALNTPSAAKANLPTGWNTNNWNHYQRLLKKVTPTLPTPTNTPATAGTGVPEKGKICFHCGWNHNHNSRRCLIMKNALPGTFTNDQMKLVKFSPSNDPHEIDNVPINQTCAPNTLPWP